MKKPINPKFTPKSATVSLKDGIHSFIDAYKLRSSFNDTSVIANWEKFVGKPIANQTSKIYIRNKVLFVRIESPVLRNELKMMKSKVMDAVNENYAEKAIEEVIFI